MTHAELDQMVAPFMEALGEHADSIQLLMTWKQGQAQTQAKEISEALHPPEDE